MSRVFVYILMSNKCRKISCALRLRNTFEQQSLQAYNPNLRLRANWRAKEREREKVIFKSPMEFLELITNSKLTTSSRSAS